MKKRDYYILLILVFLVAFAAYYRTEYCSTIEAQQNKTGINPSQQSSVLPIEAPTVKDS